MMVGKATIQEHGVYTIRAGLIDKVPTARAFLRGAKTGAGIAAETTGATVAQAVEALQAQLDSADSEQRDARRTDGAGKQIPTEGEFRRALKAIHRSEAEETMLAAHAAAGNAGLSPGGLAKAAGYKNFNAANLKYGRMAREMADYLGVPLPPSKGRKDETVATAVLADYIVHEDADDVWIMHPELRAALGTP
jgi:hypothetical protein